MVPTPIGNLEDITLRAIRTLREASRIACEDTRHTGRLLKALGIENRLLSLHAHNENQRAERVIESLRSGESIALVSDAGSPAISDPGVRLVRQVLDAGFPVEGLPGACAAITALIASGLPTDEFHFVGFLPVKSGRRNRELERLQNLPTTLVLYESTYRIEKLIGELEARFPLQPVVVARELTKKYENFYRGTPSIVLEAMKQGSLKGEFVVLIDNRPQRGASNDGDDTTP